MENSIGLKRVKANIVVLFQIVLETHERAREYDNVLVDLDSPINQDIQINRHYIYAMSETKVCQCVSRSR